MLQKLTPEELVDMLFKWPELLSTTSKYGFDINKETELNVQYQIFYLNISRLNLKCLKLPLNILLH